MIQGYAEKSKIGLQDSFAAFGNADFLVRDTHAVVSFLRENEFLLSLLHQASEKLKQAVRDAKIALSVFRDPEGHDAPYLLGVIESQVPLMQRYEAQEALRQSWWLDASAAAGDKFHIEF